MRLGSVETRTFPRSGCGSYFFFSSAPRRFDATFSVILITSEPVAERANLQPKAVARHGRLFIGYYFDAVAGWRGCGLEQGRGVAIASIEDPGGAPLRGGAGGGPTAALTTHFISRKGRIVNGIHSLSSSEDGDFIGLGRLPAITSYHLLLKPENYNP